MAWVSAQVPPALKVASSAKMMGGVPGGVAADVVTIHAPIKVSPSAFTLVVALEINKAASTKQLAAKHSHCFFTVFLLRSSARDMGRRRMQSRPVPLTYTAPDRRFPTLLKRKSGQKTAMSNLLNLVWVDEPGGKRLPGVVALPRPRPNLQPRGGYVCLVLPRDNPTTPGLV